MYLETLALPPKKTYSKNMNSKQKSCIFLEGEMEEGRGDAESNK